jgi:hypothetical protein
MLPFRGTLRAESSLFTSVSIEERFLASHEMIKKSSFPQSVKSKIPDYRVRNLQTIALISGTV